MRLSDAFRRYAEIEELAATLYDRFAEDWSDDPEVAEFWRRMSATERFHAASLHDAAAKLETGGRTTTIDQRSIAAIHGFMTAMATEIGAKDLDQALRVALEIESIELDRMYRELADREAPSADLGGLFAEGGAAIAEHEESLLAIAEARSRDAGLLAAVRRLRERQIAGGGSPLAAMLHRVLDARRFR